MLSSLRNRITSVSVIAPDGAYSVIMESHSEYMLRRSREERDAANRASTPKVRDLHMEMAGRYRDAADGPPPAKRKDSARSTMPVDFRILD